MKNPKVGQVVATKKTEKLWGMKKGMLGEVVNVEHHTSESHNWIEVKVQFPDLDDRELTFVNTELKHVADEAVLKTAGTLNLRDVTVIVPNSDKKNAKGVRVVVHALEDTVGGGVAIEAHLLNEDDSSILFEFPWDQPLVVLR
jgi:hypothetical protein